VKHYPVRNEKNRAYRNRGAGVGFEDVSDAWGLGEIGVSYGAAYADLDRDGDLDAVVLNVGAQVLVYRHEYLLRIDLKFVIGHRSTGFLLL
jgi:hypothetical protein